MKIDYLAFKHKGAKRKKCQDVYSVESINGGMILLLSDGVSSKRYSDTGARFLHKNLIEQFEKKDINHISKEEIKEIIISTIMITIFQLSRKLNCSWMEFSSTLLMILIPDEIQGFYSAHIGDGMIGVVREDKSVIMLSVPENGITRQYTYTTTASNLEKHLRIAQHDYKGDVFMMTDGMANEILDNLGRHMRMLQERSWRELEYVMIEENIEDDIGFCEVRVS